MAFAVNQPTPKSSTVKAADKIAQAEPTGFQSIDGPLSHSFSDNNTGTLDALGTAAANPISQMNVANATEGNVVTNPSIPNIFGALATLAGFGSTVNPVGAVLSLANAGGNRGTNQGFGRESEITDLDPKVVADNATSNFGTPTGFNASGVSIGPGTTGVSSTGVGFGGIGQSPDLAAASGKYGQGVNLSPTGREDMADNGQPTAPSVSGPTGPGSSSGGVPGAADNAPTDTGPGPGPGPSDGATGGGTDAATAHTGMQVPGGPGSEQTTTLQGGETVVPRGPFADLAAQLIGKSPIRNYINPHKMATTDQQPQADPRQMLLQAIAQMIGNSSMHHIESKGGGKNQESATTAGAAPASAASADRGGSQSQNGMAVIQELLSRFASNPGSAGMARS